MRWLVAASCLLGAAASAAAADRKVPSTDYPTIQAAADAAQPGDRILVAKGVYRENVVLTQSGVQVIGRKAILDGNIAGTDGVVLSVTGDDVSVSGFVFRGGTRHILQSGNGFHLSKCTFRRTSSYNPSVRIVGNDPVVTGCVSVAALDTAFSIAGDGAQVLKNRVSRAGENGIYIVGNDAVVDGNSVLIVEDSELIYVSGDNATVTRNKVGYSDGDGISVNSDGCTVEGNSCTGCGDYSIEVIGDAINVLKNRVAFTADDADGIYVKSRTAAGGGLVEGNQVSDSVEYGFYANAVHNLVIRGNRAQRCGSEQEQCFYITGDNNTIDGNLAEEANDDGFYVSGSGNVLTGNAAKNCYTDGFHIVGAGNSLDRCTATGCDGEGLDNRGTSTTVTNSTFLGNRIDLAGDILGGASFDVTTGNKFVTGGLTTQPEVD